MTPVYGLFRDPDLAQAAVDQLRARGVPDGDIVVMSSEPHEEHEFTRRDHSTAIYRIAALGGATGCAFAVWLTRTTQQLWPINTGGMPIVSSIPNAIVIFETTMLGAIIATVVTLLVSAGLPSWRTRMYDVEVSNGDILVGVENPPSDSTESLRHVLEAVGGRVKG